MLKVLNVFTWKYFQYVICGTIWNISNDCRIFNNSFWSNVTLIFHLLNPFSKHYKEFANIQLDLQLIFCCNYHMHLAIVPSCLGQAA
jgi:hypothetical protein